MISGIGKLLFALALIPSNAWANQVLLVDPTFGLASDPVFGDPLKYAIQDASLTGPSSGAGPFVIGVDTNYGVPLPGSPDVIPSFIEQGFATLWMGDFLIQQGNLYFAVVLSPHDGYAAGDVYQGSGFQDSVFFNRGVPVSLAPGGVQIGTGTVSAAVNVGCNGVQCAQFRAIDSFTLDPGKSFIDWNAPFTVQMASATCANGLLFFSSVGEETPEPAPGGVVTLALAGILGWRYFLSSRRIKASRRSQA
jgi:hypothetical protein